MLHRETNKNFNRLPLCQFRSASHDERNTAACSFTKDSVSIIKRTDHQFKYVLILPVTGLTGRFQQRTVIQSDHEGKIYAAAVACR